ncbi:hypothetical protein CTI12_AA585880 [Artemisia annua]|uniref:Uncharacterized protein n=1 Tax=Artemisia annua TaxID=35608 RepID=A0A2U1KMF8_ARTAN|nr:hypothetical protein CTI12_AA585880 [Artemisia annua]
MEGENESVTPIVYSGEEASAPKLNEHVSAVDAPISTMQNQTVAAQPLSNLADPIMEFIGNLSLKE